MASGVIGSKKKDLPLINSEDSGDEEMEEDVFSEELGDF